MTAPLTPLTDEQFETISRDVFLCDFSRADFLSVIAYARRHRAELAKARAEIAKLRGVVVRAGKYLDSASYPTSGTDTRADCLAACIAALAPEGKEGG